MDLDKTWKPYYATCPVCNLGYTILKLGSYANLSYNCNPGLHFSNYVLPFKLRYTILQLGNYVNLP